MLAQVLSIFNPVEDLASKPDGEIPEKVSYPQKHPGLAGS